MTGLLNYFNQPVKIEGGLGSLFTREPRRPMFWPVSRASLDPNASRKLEDHEVVAPAWAKGLADAWDTVSAHMSGAQIPDQQLAPAVFDMASTTGLAAPVTGAGSQAVSAFANAAKSPGLMQGIRAYHGSPHDFDKFSMDKVGTGEGAQAYGHGLYFAEGEGVARSYRDKLAPPVLYKGYKAFPDTEALTKIPAAEGDAVWALTQKMRGDNAYNGPRISAQEAKDQLLKQYDEMLNAAELDAPTNAARQMNREKRKRIQALRENVAKLNADNFDDNPGRMYEVNIKANPDDFLDWDKPLSEQPAGFYKSMEDKPNRFAIISPDGKFATTNLTKDQSEEFIADFRRGYSRLGGDPDEWKIVDFSQKDQMPARPIYEGFDVRGETSEFVRSGIPGIKYLDQGSRASGEGSRNYVVFDDKLIEILKKYGLAGLMAGGGASAMGGDAQAAQKPRGLLGSLGAY